MNAALVLLVSMVLFGLAYIFYGGFLAKRVFGLDNSRKTPAYTKEDGVDFVPTNKFVLLGHHFASIAGASPIVGPALAVIYGWVPALIWVVFGSIFMGAVHDFGALLISVRNEGRTIGDLVSDVIGGRGRILFLSMGICVFILVLAVFPIVIASLFAGTPESVVPSFALIPIAILVGFLMYRLKLPLVLVTAIGLVLMGVAMFYGVTHPVGESVSQSTWVGVLLIYAFIASVMPVWLLLQPRDYLNSFWLYLGLGAIALGVFIVRPTIQADAVRMVPSGAENFPMLPFLFITIACGAVSGAHCLFSSGTTSRQIKCETDAKGIGYGGMLMEGFLAVLAILACTAGVASREQWLANYSDYGSAMGGKLEAFIDGSAMFVAGLGIPEHVGRTLVAVTVIGFALTTLDTSARTLRFMMSEFGAVVKLPFSSNRYLASGLGCVIAFFLATYKVTVGGEQVPPGMIIWPVFGVSNQVLACLALLVISLFLYKAGKPMLYTLIPMFIMLTITLYALVFSLKTWVASHQWPLVVIGVAVTICEVWLVIEGAIALRKMITTRVPQPDSAT